VTTASCIYEGTIRHRRAQPRREFRHRLALCYLDLEELPGLLGGLLVSERPGLVRFRRQDYLGDPADALDQAVRDAVETRTGSRPAGPVRILTQLRSFGHCFNPVSFYYCLDSEGSRIDTLLAEVTNTPWGERESYAITAGRGDFVKALHVSPFMGMDHVYNARASMPAETLSVHIESRQHGARVFDATLALSRRELTTESLRRMTVRYPLQSFRVLALIYLHALGLRLAGAPVFPHPKTGRPAG
jgi:DUF1365 family protein